MVGPRQEEKSGIEPIVEPVDPIESIDIDDLHRLEEFYRAGDLPNTSPQLTPTSRWHEDGSSELSDTDEDTDEELLTDTGEEPSSDPIINSSIEWLDIDF